MITTGAQPRIRSHRDLLIWQKAMDLVDSIYDVTERFPAKEEFRLTSQLIRAAISVPSNIAEGQTRTTSKDFANFLATALASLAEIDTQITIALRRRYITEACANNLYQALSEIGKMTTSLRSKIVGRSHRH